MLRDCNSLSPSSVTDSMAAAINIEARFSTIRMDYDMLKAQKMVVLYQ